MKLIDGTALADRLLADAITDDQRRQAILIGKVIEEMLKAQLSEEGATSDCISRKAAIDQLHQSYNLLDAERRLEDLPSAQPETCEGCKHLGKWEDEVEYGYPSPCTCCKRKAVDHYER